jgi:Kdo2-lipid IVA lauroyltransferase/acyltransferase
MLHRLITNLPSRPLGHLLGHGFYLFNRQARRTVRRNLEFAFPDLSAAVVRARARRIFGNYGISLVEILQLGFMTPADVARRVRVYGVKHFHDAYLQKRGVIAISAHMGNWELGVQAMPCLFGGKVTAVAKRFKDNQFERWLHHVRTRFGNSILYKKGALAEMTAILRGGGVLAVLVDMPRRKDGVDVTFFGKRATATPAVAMLALRCRCPVVPVFCAREPDGVIGIHAHPPVEMRRSRDLRADLVENTQRITDVVERAVRENPEQWHWLMRRWKEHYPQLYR